MVPGAGQGLAPGHLQLAGTLPTSLRVPATPWGLSVPHPHGGSAPLKGRPAGSAGQGRDSVTHTLWVLSLPPGPLPPPAELGDLQQEPSAGPPARCSGCCTCQAWERLPPPSPGPQQPPDLRATLRSLSPRRGPLTHSIPVIHSPASTSPHPFLSCSASVPGSRGSSPGPAAHVVLIKDTPPVCCRPWWSFCLPLTECGARWATSSL